MPYRTSALMSELDHIVRDPNYFREGKNLPEEAKKVIDAQDVWEIALIHEIPEEDLGKLRYAFIATDLEHYNGVQSHWFEKEAYLIQQRTGIRPSDLELIDDAIKNKNMERHRLVYALNNPEKVILDFEVYCENQETLELFLDAAEQLHSYPYYSKIMTKSIESWAKDIPEFSAPFFRTA